jgi:hypothetical protein
VKVQDRYVVRQAGDRWSVVYNSKRLLDFDDRGTALQAAIMAAKRGHEHGIVAEVLTQDAAGAARPLWHSERDAFSVR